MKQVHNANSLLHSFRQFASCWKIKEKGLGGERKIGYQEKFLQVRTTDEVRSLESTLNNKIECTGIQFKPPTDTDWSLISQRVYSFTERIQNHTFMPFQSFWSSVSFVSLLCGLLYPGLVVITGLIFTSETTRNKQRGFLEVGQKTVWLHGTHGFNWFESVLRN